jgi:hypothetical protein
MESFAPILGLSRKEHAVFSSLTHEAQSITHIARKARLPVRTAGFTMRKLHERSLVRRVTGGHATWKRAADAAIARQVNKSIHDLTGSRPEHTHATRAFTFSRPKIKVRLIKGVKDIALVYHQAYASRKSERIFLTQSPSAVHKFTADKRIAHLARRANKIGEEYKGILELIMSDETKPIFAGFAKSPKWIKSQEKRLLDISLVPREYLPDTFGEIFIFQDNVMLTDWATEVAVIITNHHIAKLVNAVYQGCKDQGRTFDAHGFVKFAHSEQRKKRLK